MSDVREWKSGFSEWLLPPVLNFSAREPLPIGAHNSCWKASFSVLYIHGWRIRDSTFATRAPGRTEDVWHLCITIGASRIRTGRYPNRSPAQDVLREILRLTGEGVFLKASVARTSGVRVRLCALAEKLWPMA